MPKLYVILCCTCETIKGDKIDEVMCFKKNRLDRATSVENSLGYCLFHNIIISVSE